VFASCGPWESERGLRKDAAAPRSSRGVEQLASSQAPKARAWITPLPAWMIGSFASAR
jgi:hypothetical protein